MPFLDPDQVQVTSHLVGAPDPVATDEPDFWTETVPAAFRLENTMGSMRANDVGYIAGRSVSDLDPDFDPAPLIPEQYLDYSDLYAKANTVGEVREVTRQLEREQQDAQTIADSGVSGFLAAMAAGTFDPINLVPVGGVAYKTYRTGGSILRNAAAIGSAAMVGASVQEAALMHQQHTRTYGDVAANIAAAGFLGAVIGGGATGVQRAFAGRDAATIDAVIKAVEDDLNLDVENLGGGSVGAAAAGGLPKRVLNRIEAELKAEIDKGKVDPADAGSELARRIHEGTLEFEGIDKNAAVAAVLHVVGRQDPLVRGLGSSSTTTQQATQVLGEIPLQLTKNTEGAATPQSVQALVRIWDGNRYRALRALDDFFVRYDKGRAKRFGDIVGSQLARKVFGAAKDANGQTRLSYTEFKNEVGKAMRNGDQHDIPEVAEAARVFREEVYEPLKQAAVDAGLFDGVDLDVKTAMSYLNRVYNKEKLVDPVEGARFDERVANWLERKQQEARIREDNYETDIKRLSNEVRTLEVEVEKIPPGHFSEKANQLRKDLTAKRKELGAREDAHFRDEIDARLDRADFVDIAKQIRLRILGTPAGRLPYDVEIPTPGGKGADTAAATRRGPLKARKFLIEDSEIEEWLDSDIESLSKIYARTMAPDVELTKALGRDFMEFNGALDNVSADSLPDLFKQIIRDWEKWGRANPKTGGKWKDKADSDIKDLMALRDKIRGVYGVPDDPLALGTRIGRGMRQLNYVRLLGGMTLSAIPDLARPVMVNGLRNVFGDVLVPFATNFSALAKGGAAIRDMGLAADMLLNSRVQAIADIADDFARLSKLERGIGAISDTFGMVSLMAPWNTAMKQIAGISSMQRMHRALTAELGGKLGEKESAWLRSTGIDKPMGERILRQFEKHGGNEGGLNIPNWLKWDDQEAAKLFHTAMGREIERIIVTPGLDVPLVASGAWGEGGRHIFQFKSFALAATQRILLSGLQQKDMAALNGAVFSVALGMLVYMAKNADAGREIDTDPSVLLKEGIDRSGLTAWLSDANNIVEKVTHGKVGMSAVLGGPPMSRYASRNALGAVAGPTFGLLQTGISVAGAPFSESGVRQADIRAMRRLLPYQNLVGFRRILDQAEQGVADAMGVR